MSIPGWFFFFLLAVTLTCGTSVLRPGIEPTPPALEDKVLTTVSLGKSAGFSFSRQLNLNDFHSEAPVASWVSQSVCQRPSKAPPGLYTVPTHRGCTFSSLYIFSADSSLSDPTLLDADHSSPSGHFCCSVSVCRYSVSIHIQFATSPLLTPAPEFPYQRHHPWPYGIK